MKRFLCGLVVLGLFLGALGSARSDFIYWTDTGSGRIERANTDGTGRTVLISGLNNPSCIALDVAAGKLPEPSTLLLLGIGTLGLIGWTWRRWKLVAA